MDFGLCWEPWKGVWFWGQSFSGILQSCFPGHLSLNRQVFGSIRLVDIVAKLVQCSGLRTEDRDLYHHNRMVDDCGLASILNFGRDVHESHWRFVWVRPSETSQSQYSSIIDKVTGFLSTQREWIIHRSFPISRELFRTGSSSIRCSYPPWWWRKYCC